VKEECLKSGYLKNELIESHELDEMSGSNKKLVEMSQTIGVPVYNMQEVDKHFNCKIHMKLTKFTF
jgi:hypothetical protein